MKKSNFLRDRSFSVASCGELQLFAGLDLVAHEGGEDFVGDDEILQMMQCVQLIPAF